MKIIKGIFGPHVTSDQANNVVDYALLSKSEAHFTEGIPIGMSSETVRGFLQKTPNDFMNRIYNDLPNVLGAEPLNEFLETAALLEKNSFSYLSLKDNNYNYTSFTPFLGDFERNYLKWKLYATQFSEVSFQRESIFLENIIQYIENQYENRDVVVTFNFGLAHKDSMESILKTKLCNKNDYSFEVMTYDEELFGQKFVLGDSEEAFINRIDFLLFGIDYLLKNKLPLVGTLNHSHVLLLNDIAVAYANSNKNWEELCQWSQEIFLAINSIH